MTNSQNISAQDGSWTKVEENECKRQVSQGVAAGIPIDFIEEHVNQEYFESLLAGPYKQKQRWAKYVFSAAKTWGLTGQYLVVEGGSQINRDCIGKICLYRGIVANSLEANRIALSLSMSEVTGLLSSAPVARTDSVELLKGIPVLMLTELDLMGEFRKYSESRLLFDGLLNGRETMGRPTIITVEGNISDSPGEMRERYGAKMARILSGEDHNTMILEAIE